jgi:transcriptional regulator with XRE-family HTH domain
MNKIAIARKELGLSQKQLAKKIGKLTSEIGRWETEKYFPSNKNLKDLSKILKKPKSYFLEDKEPKIAKYNMLEKNVKNHNLRLKLLEKEFELLKSKLKI